jgi:hypothetical protein
LLLQQIRERNEIDRHPLVGQFAHGLINPAMPLSIKILCLQRYNPLNGIRVDETRSQDRYLCLDVGRDHHG